MSGVAVPSLEVLAVKVREADELVQSMSLEHDFAGVFVAAQGILSRNMALIADIGALESRLESGAGAGASASEGGGESCSEGSSEEEAAAQIVTAAEKICELNKNLDEIVRLYSEYAPKDKAADE
jgi:hypothetical protein